jgi:hypothetical protein
LRSAAGSSSSIELSRPAQQWSINQSIKSSSRLVSPSHVKKKKADSHIMTYLLPLTCSRLSRGREEEETVGLHGHACMHACVRARLLLSCMAYTSTKERWIQTLFAREGRTGQPCDGPSERCGNPVQTQGRIEMGEGNLVGSSGSFGDDGRLEL